jgi:hypothetical protein
LARRVGQQQGWKQTAELAAAESVGISYFSPKSFIFFAVSPDLLGAPKANRVIRFSTVILNYNTI